MKDHIFRRQALVILGLTGIGAGGYYASEEGFLAQDGANAEQQLGGTPETATATPPESAYQALQQEVNRREENAPKPEPRVQFDYGRVAVEEVENAPFSAVLAEANESQTGDRIELRVGEVSGERLTTMLRAVWRVESNLATSVTIGGETIRFAGGEHKDYTVLLGVDEESTPSRVLVARGETTNEANEMIHEFE